MAVGAWTLGANLFQNVATGVHESCPESSTSHGKGFVKSPPSRDNFPGGYAPSSGIAEASLFNADLPSSSSPSVPGSTSRNSKAFPDPEQELDKEEVESDLGISLHDDDGNRSIPALRGTVACRHDCNVFSRLRPQDRSG